MAVSVSTPELTTLRLLIKAGVAVLPLFYQLFSAPAPV